MVPGPDISAITLTNENASLMIPKPSPETENTEKLENVFMKQYDNVVINHDHVMTMTYNRARSTWVAFALKWGGG